MSALRHPDPKDPGAYLRILRFKNMFLDKIHRCCDQLEPYEKDERARETREELFKILKENGRYPEEDKEEDKEE